MDKEAIYHVTCNFFDRYLAGNYLDVGYIIGLLIPYLQQFNNGNLLTDINITIMYKVPINYRVTSEFAYLSVLLTVLIGGPIDLW